MREATSSGAAAAAMPSPTFDTVDLSLDGRLATLTLDRPEHLNPLSTAMLIELADAAQWLDRHSEADVVVVTGRAQAADRARGDALGAEAYLSKPFEPAELVTVVGRLAISG